MLPMSLFSADLPQNQPYGIPMMQQGIGQIGPYGMGMGGFNPYQQAPSQGFDMYLLQNMGMGGGFNPYQQGMGGGFNPYQQMMGGGFNPYQQGMGGFNPYQQMMGGGFNPYQQMMGGGFNPYQQMMGGFNPYQQMMGGGFNPFQQGMGGFNPSIPGMGDFNPYMQQPARNPFASMRQGLGQMPRPQPMPQQTFDMPEPLPMRPMANEPSQDIGALPISRFMPNISSPTQSTPAGGIAGIQAGMTSPITSSLPQQPMSPQQQRYMDALSTPARPPQQFQPTGPADMAYRGPAMTPQQLLDRAQANRQLEQQRRGMQQQTMGPPAPTSQYSIGAGNVSAPAAQPSMGRSLSMGPQQPSVQNASNQAAGGQPARLF